MPIEIKELFIKINVNDESQTNAAPDKNAGGKKQGIIEACLDQFVEIQNRKNER